MAHKSSPKESQFTSNVVEAVTFEFNYEGAAVAAESEGAIEEGIINSLHRL